jgi:predicted transport protein
MGLEPELQTRLYEHFWRPMELDFGQEAYGTHFDAFMRHYLTVKTGEIPNVSEVYEAFKTYARSPANAAAGVEALVKDLREFAGYFCAMALDDEIDSDLKIAFSDLRELKVDVAYPFLLEMYSDYSRKILSKGDFVRAVRLVEAYVFRRAICSIPTNSMNKTFATFARALKKDRYLESIEAHFMLLPSYRRFPSDDEFERELHTRDLYNFRSRSYWLRRLENHDRKERVPVNEFTIEHILPQNESLPDYWKQALGPEWESVRDKWLHTLGNLTLTGYNSEYSDHSFKDKRDHRMGFKMSPLKLNQGLGGLEEWNEETIQARADRLAEEALKVWPPPTVDIKTLQAYRPRTETTTTYSIEDHPYLLSGKPSELFETLSKEVMLLDPCVTREFLKFYIAFKAETNFVDIVPQAKRLLLMLNMHFEELNDPKKVARDVTNLGRWGNGDVEVAFSSLNELPYVIGLVRQSLEKQLGSIDGA